MCWHVSLIPPRAERGEVGCGVKLLGNISWISGSGEINVILPCYYLRLGSCVLEIMTARRSRVKAYTSQIMQSSDLPLAVVGGQERRNISNLYGIWQRHIGRK